MQEDGGNIIEFQRLHPDAKLPVRGSDRAAGLDLCSLETVSIEPRTRVSVRTGLAVAIPPGHYGRVAPRSGLAFEHGIDVLAGVIDSDYRGEVICLLFNLGEATVRLARGARIAQLIVEPILMLEPEWVDELEQTSRGPAGFGSTDRQ
jgi:dUTP pyrophosphatase